MITGTEYTAEDALPRGIDISNYPNPFNPTTTITVTLDKPGEVKIRVANAIGQIVQTISQSRLSSSVHTFRFDGRNLASGLYFVVLNTPQAQQVHKMMLIK
jgi:flagellar hook assembly protein FlgD